MLWRQNKARADHRPDRPSFSCSKVAFISVKELLFMSTFAAGDGRILLIQAGNDVLDVTSGQFGCSLNGSGFS